MKVFIFLFYFANIFIGVKGQSSRDRLIFVLDSNTKQPIHFASIKSIKIKYGTFTNMDGSFKLSKELNDSIIISSVGYNNKIAIGTNIVNDTIYLQRKWYVLPTVNIKSRKLIGEKIFGIESAKKSIIWTSAGFGDEFVQKIRFPDSTKILRVKSVTIAFERFDETIPMILRIYNAGLDGLPNEDILLNKILIKRSDFNKRKRRVILDLTSENILIIDSICFIGVEWLPVANPGIIPTSAIILTDDLLERLTYTRSFFYSRNKWSLPLKLPWQNKTHQNNTIISVKVEVLD